MFKHYGISLKSVTEDTPEAFTAAIDEKDQDILCREYCELRVSRQWYPRARKDALFIFFASGIISG